MNLINILYLTPYDLFKDNYFLMQQWSSLESLIPCFLKSLYNGKVDVKLHEFDKLFSGLKNVQNLKDQDVLAKTASLWYYLTRITHQSIGPRVGRFAEDLIKYWLERSGCYITVEKNITLSKVLNTYFGLQSGYRNKLDFFVKSNDKAIFIELRMSEHTGGRTGQESLLDKFNKILDLVVSEKLVEESIKRGINTIELAIAILFNENQELINRQKKNYNEGRLNSLISYIMEENHIWGRISKMANYYVFCDNNKSSIDKGEFERTMKSDHEMCLRHKMKDFKIHLRILLGDEFFKKIVGKGLQELIEEHGEVIADDLWIMYTLTLNELKIVSELNKTNPRKIYELRNKAEFKDFFNRFKKLYHDYQGRSKSSEINPLMEYIKHLNEIIDELTKRVLAFFSERGWKLRLLETNDVAMAYRYLRYVCAATLALYLTIDVRGDKFFSKCRWLSYEEN